MSLPPEVDRPTAGAPPAPAAVRLLGWVVQGATWIAAAAAVLMMVHISVDVISKYLFRAPLPGTITIVSNYYMVLVAFLPLAFAERRNGHIGVEVLTTRFPARVQRILHIVSLLFCAAVFAALTWQSWIEAGRALKIGAFEIEFGVKLLTWPARYLLPLGAGLMTAALLAKAALALLRGPAQDPEARVF
ncbi:TRAP transporter small permease [Albimonas sp. CAU 1670]|uniref:TRAP transporter small permease n=1 Tax=Albimonas sp. CAU 1670 TaxID=3032599 RepID=UPI0023DCB55C|nr:TRAP transporter small permease [Albimonas sp. CAU 1670]MDF2235703.1 TRAP transporter small permease [Albimonas sp. CAU 1670]